jgi:Na+/H+-dicarboxylate symporter
MTNSAKTSLTTRILIGLGAGLLVGWITNALFTGVSFDLGLFEFAPKAFISDIFNVGGQIFVNTLKMMVVPLVFVSLVCGMCSLSDTSKLGRLGGKSISLYIITTAVAITIAIALAIFISPGEGANFTSAATMSGKEAPTLGQVIIDMFPSNPIAAMAEGKMLQIIVFAILFGLAMILSGEAGKRLVKLFDDINTVNLRLVGILMQFAPIGVFCLIGKLAATFDIAKFGSYLIYYFFTVLLALFIHALITYPLILKMLSGLNPITFFKKLKNAQLFAFSTASSSATLPVTLETATKKLGISTSVASFTVPLGATINMDGTAIMQGVATVFIAQAFNVDLSLSQYLMVIMTATLASIGTAGVPGVGLIMLTMVLQQVGLPLEGIGIIMAVDRLLDMTRTAVNVTGDCTVSCIVAKSEGEFDMAIFEDPKAGHVSEVEVELAAAK